MFLYHALVHARHVVCFRALPRFLGIFFHDSSSLIVVFSLCRNSGLGAALRLSELGHTNWTLYDAFEEAGGLAFTFLMHGMYSGTSSDMIFSHALAVLRSMTCLKLP